VNSTAAGAVQSVVFQTWPSPPNLKSLGVETLDLPFGDPKYGMIHILGSHAPGGPNSAGQSVFDSIVIVGFDTFLQAGLPFGIAQDQGREIVVEVHALVEIGTDATGSRTHDFRTVIARSSTLGPGGYRVITSYPIPEGTSDSFRR